MDEATVSRLEAMASRLGVRVDEVFQTVTREIVVRSWVGIAGGVVLLALACVGAAWMFRRMRDDPYDGLSVALGVASALSAVFGFTLVGCCASDLAAPTATALRALMGK